METQVVNNEIELIDKELKESERQEQTRRKEIEHRLVGKLTKLPQLLRFFGATVLLASAAAFLMQQWGGMNHVLRYFSFLGFTGVLAGCGFLCGLRIREDKGARTFLAIAAAIVPVHFLQLGGLLFSRFGEVPYNVPKYFQWVAPDAATALLTTGIGVVALVPIILLAFMALCRSQALQLTAIYVVANALLLVPTRSPDLIGLLAACTLVVIAIIDSALFARLPAMKTKEGLLVRLMLFVPGLSMIGRNLELYTTSELFYCMVFAAVSVYLFEVFPKYVSKTALVKFCRFLSTITAALAWALFCIKFFDVFSMPNEFVTPVLILPYSLLLLAMSLVAGPNYRKTSAMIAILGMSLQLCLFEGVLSSFLIVAISILTAAYGFASEDRLTFYNGVVGLTIGLVYHMKYAIDIYTLSPWLSLGVLGVATVLASSLIERNYGGIVKQAGLFRQKMSTWH